jgi:predicted membrane channel-forming protein YqfA (hemolysin III family)
MENQNSWKGPLIVVGICLLAIFFYAAVGRMQLDAGMLGVIFLIQSLFSFFLFSSLGHQLKKIDQKVADKSICYRCKRYNFTFSELK